jgi:protein TonB
MRNRASNSSQLAGLSIAALITALAGVALANGFGQTIIRMIEIPITFTPIPEDAIPPEPTERQPLDLGGETLTAPKTLPAPDINFVAEDPPITGSPEPRVIVTNTPTARVPPAPAPVRMRPVLLQQSKPDYPPSAIRQQQQGVSTLEVCVDARGRTSSATLASSSGHQALDNAALKWVRNARFTPGKLDGVAQSICGHTVVYEWNLADAR